jgi:hypothetical protein
LVSSPPPTPRTAFHCRALGCLLPMGTCVRRQARSDRQLRTTQTWRGDGLDFPFCVTTRCELGRQVRGALDPDTTWSWRGAGPGGRFEGSRPAREKRLQLAARDHLLAEGALDAPRSIDDLDSSR